MNARHRKTLEAISTEPTAANISWARIEALFKAIGCIVIEGRGSRVRFAYGQRVITFHRPHPSKEAKPYQVEDTRIFLKSIGILP
ncbi:type II toxin-antitoxin system HicA family toxin [Desulfonatronum thioautotrophicum]|uniref:type II toxin-antitoxin system HicA family toxin n=1 Tax=Desulfonatronum thioautotrophicum TaxID=617001 RepID=UPI0005EBD8D8|nr:type II toxin-antitoxin system HicA family toxin [Desulfonatronum thioautotrophicum]